MRRQLHKNVQQEDGLNLLQAPEPGVVHFKTDVLQFRCSLNVTSLQMLQLQVTPPPELQDQWSLEEMQVLEKYFEVKMSGPPYKPGSMIAFTRLMIAPLRILKDFIQLMRLELVPDRNLKWTLQWCLTFSPVSPLAAPLGVPAVVIKSNRILVMFQLTRQPPPPGQQTPTGPETLGGLQTLVVPLLYDIGNCQVSLAEKGVTQPQVNMVVNQCLKRAFEFMAAKAQPGDSLLFPIIREMLATL